MSEEILLIKYVEEKNIEKIKERIKTHPEEINKQDDKTGFTAIMFLFDVLFGIPSITYSDKHREEILELLLENGADINLILQDGKTIFMKLINKVNLEELKILMRYEPVLDICDNSGRNCYSLVKEDVVKFHILSSYETDKKFKKLEDKVMKKLDEIHNEIRELRYQPGNVGFFEAKKHFVDTENETAGKKNTF